MSINIERKRELDKFVQNEVKLNISALVARMVKLGDDKDIPPHAIDYETAATSAGWVDKWKFIISPDGCQSVIVDPEGYTILELATFENSSTANDFEANVQLITAAPMLVEALLRMLERTSGQAAYTFMEADREFAKHALNRALWPAVASEESHDNAE